MAFERGSGIAGGGSTTSAVKPKKKVYPNGYTPVSDAGTRSEPKQPQKSTTSTNPYYPKKTQTASFSSKSKVKVGSNDTNTANKIRSMFNESKVKVGGGTTNIAGRTPVKSGTSFSTPGISGVNIQKNSGGSMTAPAISGYQVKKSKKK